MRQNQSDNVIPRRSVRRAHREKYLERTRRLVKLFGLSEADQEKFAIRWADNRKKCSCALCGHRRRWEGATLAERRSELALREE